MSCNAWHTLGNQPRKHISRSQRNVSHRNSAFDDGGEGRYYTELKVVDIIDGALNRRPVIVKCFTFKGIKWPCWTADTAQRIIAQLE